MDAICFLDHSNWDLSLSNTSIGGNQLNLSTTAISLHNITTAFVSNLSLLLFDSPINLSLVRLLLCDRELFCSILFLFGYLLLHCWPKIVRQICLKKDHFCWNLRQDEATTESPDSPYTGSKYLFAKKLILFIWVVIQLVEFGFHLWIRQETHVLDEDQSARLFTGGFNIHSPIWAHLVQLLVLSCLAHHLVGKVSPTIVSTDILVSLHWLITTLNSFASVISFYIQIPLQTTSLSFYSICSYCVWTGSPGTRHPASLLKQSLVAQHFEVNQTHLDFYFYFIYTCIASSQLVLSFWPNFTLVKKINGDPEMNPEKYSTFFGRLLFAWFNSVVYKGYCRPLAVEDIHLPMQRDTVQPVAEKFQSLYYKPANQLRKPGLFNFTKSPTCHLISVLIRQFGWQFFLISTLKLAPSILTFFSPILLDRLLQFIQNGDKQPQWHGVFYVLSMFLLAIIESILNLQFNCLITALALRIRACLTATIYGKVLHHCEGYTSGQVVNIMSIDTERVLEYFKFVNLIWICPIQIAISIYLLWNQLGYSSLAGLSVLLLLLPFNAYIGAKMRGCQTQLLEFKDQRLRLLNEAISGVRALKLYAWEEAFYRRIDTTRLAEVKRLRVLAFFSSAITFVFASGTFFVSLASFGSYILLNPTAQITAQKVFVSMAIFDIIRRPLAFLPKLITNTILFLVSMKRISEFLNTSSLSSKRTAQPFSTLQSPQISIRNGVFVHSVGSKFQLQISELELTEPKLYAVIGEMGGGKSSLLAAILGQMNFAGEQCTVSGRLAYVPQNVWIQSGTVRENILFGLPYSDQWFWKVVDACALREDFKQLTDGELTIVGDQGFNLSGGQKQRISLARALYTKADIYLFDDPLSALDNQVARHIFSKVIHSSGLLKDKIRILVTHNQSLLPHVDSILLIHRGRFVTQLTYSQLKEDQLESCFSNSDLLPSNPEMEKFVDSQPEPLDEAHFSFPSRQISTTSPDWKTTDHMEQLKTGSISWKVYFKYFRMIGWFYSFLILLFYTSSSITGVATSFWLSAWSNDSLNSTQNATSAHCHSQIHRLAIFALCGLTNTVFVLLATITLHLGCIACSKRLHSQILYRLLRAPFWFFTDNSSGQILNRFSKDVDIVDDTLIATLRLMLIELFRTMANFVSISVGTHSASILLFFTPLLVIYWFIYNFYISTARQLTRLNSALRSPIYTLFSETYTGVHVIQAFENGRNFLRKAYCYIDKYNSACYMNVIASRWLSIRVEILGNLIVLSTSLLCAVMRDNISPGMAGLSITCAMKVTGTLNLLIQSFTDLVNHLVSVERLCEYTSLPEEANWHTISGNDEIVSKKSITRKFRDIFGFDRKNSPPSLLLCPARASSSWLQNGSISMCHYFARYHHKSGYCLKNINLFIEHGIKVGIVGRTGAGKSSFALSLFRLLEPDTGHISISGICIKDLCLHELRSSLTIIPQDPLLFTGTLRDNLDPLGEFDDCQLFDSLKSAHLSHLTQTLDQKIDERICSISPGQRQLICLARAILQRPKILILDEATAAIDQATDKLIQETISRLFYDCTVLTIAHRLNTVLHYDRILVLHHGEVVEYDTPGNLMTDKSSKFYQMLQNRL